MALARGRPAAIAFLLSPPLSSYHLMDWSEVLPPPELTDFLRVIKLQQFGYDVKLAALGYDDVMSSIRLRSRSRVDQFKKFDLHFT